ncbi:HotDog domain-containing protein [Phanerochaete sordida]|uniref:HotDog domain-containing protein n=1 Tax=Phanerochaete sordida TaxID=48140 RepID=A0A9P3G6W0_9APHY|nr:HotDog domain-containing protein [Phanerochaete sordida]
MSSFYTTLLGLPKAPAPNDDISRIKGSCSDEVKQACVNALAHYGVGGPGVYGNEFTRHLTLVCADVRPRMFAPEGTEKRGLEAEVTFEIEVYPSMLNAMGSIGGGCLCHLLEICTWGSWYAIAAVTGVDPAGISQALELKFYAPAFIGMKLAIVSTSMTAKGKLVFGRAEVRGAGLCH